MQWIMQGLRTLKDVHEHGNVSENQRIGIELYEVSPQLIDVDDRNLRREFRGRKLNDIVGLYRRKPGELIRDWKYIPWDRIEQVLLPVVIYSPNFIEKLT